jgi:predicted DNA-binding protein with PD1-like motif
MPAPNGFHFTCIQLFHEFLCLCLAKVLTEPFGLYNHTGEPMMQNYTFRLKSSQDLFDSIVSFAQEKRIEAGCILSGIGSLKHFMVRLANREVPTKYVGHFEIVSLAGLVSIHGTHLHISASNGDGKTIGGHLVSGSKIYTTAELVVAVFPEMIFKREFAEDSGYDELVVYNR